MVSSKDKTMMNMQYLGGNLKRFPMTEILSSDIIRTSRQPSWRLSSDERSEEELESWRSQSPDLEF